ncbi:GNAT family N-acetyltransferase [Romboutsia sedimentorum]|uniref:GNAT family N-acetyltransferase n=1 Tax=Romboutsia sedimentorum TaxID=1368474 RepID=UPI0024DE3AC1|nr:GNAT family N-acetyltransferase [Romboutsia sedimentorum]MDK2587224.1 GNAT family N-acetyltransferase [Romboutsia sedimentorum]
MIQNYNQILVENKTMYTERLKLRPFTIDDAKYVYEYASDEQTVKYLTWPMHKDIEHTKRVIENFYIPYPGTYAVEENVSGKCIGSLGISINDKSDSVTYGIAINSQFWNKGYATEILTKAIKFTFEVLKAKKAHGEHLIGNDASGKIMLKCGMQYIGKGLIEIRGENKDTHQYAINLSDWHQI